MEQTGAAHRAEMASFAPRQAKSETKNFSVVSIQAQMELIFPANSNGPYNVYCPTVAREVPRPGLPREPFVGNNPVFTSCLFGNPKCSFGVT